MSGSGKDVSGMVGISRDEVRAGTFPDRLPPMPYQSHDHVDHGDQMELLPQGHPAQMYGPQFSNQLPPPPSTLVDPPQNYYPPYADSTHSSAPSKQGHDHELPRGPDLLC